MVLDGTQTHNFDFWDEESGRTISVTLTYKDGIMLKLLEKIIQQLGGLK